MTTRPRMRFIMKLIGPELSELSALELENLPYLTLITVYRVQRIHSSARIYEYKMGKDE